MKDIMAFIFGTSVSVGTVAFYIFIDSASTDYAERGLQAFSLIVLYGGVVGILGIALDYFRIDPFFSYSNVYSTVCNFCVAIPFLYASAYRAFEISGYTCISGSGKNYYYDELYFSYTTFVTLGYGDLKPEGFCRVLSSTESLVGYIFLGMLVAILVESLRTDRKAFLRKLQDDMRMQFSIEAKKSFDPKLVDKAMAEIKEQDSRN